MGLLLWKWERKCPYQACECLPKPEIFAQFPSFLQLCVTWYEGLILYCVNALPGFSDERLRKLSQLWRYHWEMQSYPGWCGWTIGNNQLYHDAELSAKEKQNTPTCVTKRIRWSLYQRHWARCLTHPKYSRSVLAVVIVVMDTSLSTCAVSHSKSVVITRSWKLAGSWPQDNQRASWGTCSHFKKFM